MTGADQTFLNTTSILFFKYIEMSTTRKERAMSVVLDVVTIIANIAIIVSLVIAIKSFQADNTRKLRQSTIDFYNEINKETMSLVDKVMVNKEIFTVEEIMSNAALHVQIRRYLSLMERFSVGINSDMYDIQVFDRIQGATTLSIYDALKPYLCWVHETYGLYFYGDFELVVAQIKEIRKIRTDEGYVGKLEKFGDINLRKIQKKSLIRFQAEMISSTKK